MRVVLFGDGEWASLTLEQLLSDGFDIPAVVIRREPSSMHLSEAAKNAGIPTLQPEKVNHIDFITELASIAPDVNLSIAYDQIIRQPLLDSASMGFVNIHASMLPSYRGRNIVNWAIINNEKQIGVTAHLMDEGIDTGPIILQHPITIGWHDDYNSVLTNIRRAIPLLVAEALTKLGRTEPVSQKGLPNTYVGGRRDGDEWLDWNDTSLNIYNKIRAISHPAPGARTILGSEVVVIWKAHWEEDWPRYISTPGEVVGREKDHGVLVKTGDSTIFIETIQMPLGDEITPSWAIGTRLGLNMLDLLHRIQLLGTISDWDSPNQTTHPGNTETI